MLFHARVREGQYFRLIVADHGPLWQEFYADWDDYSHYSGQILALRAEADRCLAVNSATGLADVRRSMEEALLVLFEKAKIPRESMKNQKEITLVYGSPDLYLPLEAFSWAVEVRHASPARASGGNTGPHFTHLFQEELKTSAPEAEELFGLWKNRMAGEFLAMRQAGPLALALQNTTRLHLSLHGGFSAGEGAVELLGQMVTQAPAVKNLQSVFINACHTGTAPGGFVSSLLKSGCGEVIASPYAVAWAQPAVHEGIRAYYTEVFCGSPEKAWRAASSHGLFPFLFRRFMPCQFF